MFIVELFTIAKIRKQPKCSSLDEWIKKMWSIYTIGYHSVIKKNEILPCVTILVELEGIVLSKISQKEEDKYCLMSLICKIIKNPTKTNWEVQRRDWWWQRKKQL